MPFVSRLKLSIAFVENPGTRPILDGRMEPEGIDLVCTPNNPGEIFWRQLKYADWDVSEMSFSSLMIAVARSSSATRGWC